MKKHVGVIQMDSVSPELETADKWTQLLVFLVLSRLSTPIDGEEPTSGNVVVNGLWICQLHNSDIPDKDILASFNYVGIYNRGDGE